MRSKFVSVGGPANLGFFLAVPGQKLNWDLWMWEWRDRSGQHPV